MLVRVQCVNKDFKLSLVDFALNCTTLKLTLVLGDLWKCFCVWKFGRGSKHPLKLTLHGFIGPLFFAEKLHHFFLGEFYTTLHCELNTVNRDIRLNCTTLKLTLVLGDLWKCFWVWKFGRGSNHPLELTLHGFIELLFFAEKLHHLFQGELYITLQCELNTANRDNRDTNTKSSIRIITAIPAARCWSESFLFLT